MSKNFNQQNRFADYLCMVSRGVLFLFTLFVCFNTGSSAEAAPRTRFYLKGTGVDLNRDYVCQGARWNYVPNTQYEITNRRYASVPDGHNGVRVSVQGISNPELDSWSVSFGAPNGDLFTPGLFENVNQQPSYTYDHPVLDFGGEGRGCEQSGNFVVREITYVRGGVSKFAADFTQFCIYAPSEKCRGSIRVNSKIPVWDLRLVLTKSSQTNRFTIDPQGNIYSAALKKVGQEVKSGSSSGLTLQNIQYSVTNKKGTADVFKATKNGVTKSRAFAASRRTFVIGRAAGRFAGIYFSTSAEMIESVALVGNNLVSSSVGNFE